jgi:hypothetical protein
MKNFKKLTWLALPLTLGLFVACADDDSNADPTGGASNEGGGGGSAPQGGSNSKAGNTSKAGTGNDAGAPHSAGGGGADAGGPQPRGKANPPELGAQIDRMGRPAIATALQDTFNPDAEAKGSKKDAYNAAAPADWADAQADFEVSLGILDALDGTCGNQLLAMPAAAAPYAGLAGVLADDQLYVNTDKGECAAYLGVEAEHLELVADGSCGGRTPLYDVIETSYSVLAAGILAGVDDTIAEDDAVHDLETFPFLAEPQ